MKRTQTDPGTPAPPPPGSVCPPLPVRPPPPVRGAYSVQPTDPEIEWSDETPTKPDGTLQPELLKLVRLVDSMAPVERRRFVAMVDSYTKCSLGNRVLGEELFRELARKEKT